jgi:hypothetical protein
MKERNANQSPKARDGPEGISRISVCGYKSLMSEQEVEIRPLTILAGANSSGKTSIMQPLLLLKQTLEAPYDPGPLLLDGPYVHFTSAEQLLSRTRGKQCLGTFWVALKTDGGSEIKLTFKRDPKGLALESLLYKHNGDGPHKLHEGMPEEEIVRALPTEMKEFKSAFERHEKRKARWAVVRDKWILTVGLQTLAGGERVYPLSSPVGSLPGHIERVIHLPGLRANPSRTYKATPISGFFPGTFDNYVASVVRGWQTEKSPRLGSLGSAMAELGLTWKVETRQLDDTQVELLVGRLPRSKRGGAQDLVSIADVGFGVLQALPVVVALLVAKPGNILYIEQPEIHLHPRAQTAMATLLADAARRGVRVVAETHSSVLVRSVQTLVAQGQLAPEIVKLHWFTRNPDDGSTKIDSADVDENGAFGPWPSDFDETALQVEGAYLDAVERRSSAR